MKRIPLKIILILFPNFISLCGLSQAVKENDLKLSLKNPLKTYDDTKTINGIVKNTSLHKIYYELGIEVFSYSDHKWYEEIGDLDAIALYSIKIAHIRKNRTKMFNFKLKALRSELYLTRWKRFRFFIRYGDKMTTYRKYKYVCNDFFLYP